MHVGSNPTARTSQFQSPRSPYRGAGRLFRIWFTGSMAFRRRFMICDSPLSMLPDSIAICGFHPHIPPPADRTVSPRRCLGRSYPIRRSVPLSGLAGRDITAFLPAFPFRWAGRGAYPAPLPASLFAPSASRLTPRHAFRWAARCFSLRFPIRQAGRMRVFRARIRFPVDSAAIYATLIDIHAGVVERQTRQI